MNAAIQPEVDWPALIDELRRSGFTMPQIADECRVSATAVKEWRLGIKTPLFGTGDRLVEFWCRFTERERDDIPRVQSLV